MIYSEIVAVLKTVITDVFPQRAPQGQPLPYCTYSLTGTEPNDTKTTRSVIDIRTIQVEVFEKKYVDLRYKADAIRAALENYNSQMIDSVNYDNEFDGFDDDTDKRSVIIEFKIRERRLL
jgi:Protein of unknown function (DUF3168).